MQVGVIRIRPKKDEVEIVHPNYMKSQALCETLDPAIGECDLDITLEKGDVVGLGTTGKDGSFRILIPKLDGEVTVGVLDDSTFELSVMSKFRGTEVPNQIELEVDE